MTLAVSIYTRSDQTMPRLKDSGTDSTAGSLASTRILNTQQLTSIRLYIDILFTPSFYPSSLPIFIYRDLSVHDTHSSLIS